ncbi:MAG: type IV secretion system DNA-binding domain-containing protein [Paracoccaceae bacterium]
MTRPRRTSYFTDDTSRGLDILRLQIGVQTRALRMGILMVLFGALSLGGMWFFTHVSLVETGDALIYMIAFASIRWFEHPDLPLVLWMDQGWTRQPAWQVLQFPFVLESVDKARAQGLIAAGISAVAIVPLAFLVIRLATARGRSVYSDQIARGTPIATPGQLRAKVRKTGASKIRICDVALPEQALNRHILLLGSTRSGKSLSIRRILREIERRGDMAIVFDKVGDFVQEFYKPGRRDLLMNPLDRRSAPWSPWCEGETPVDYTRIARSLIPRRPNDRNVYFQEAARTLLVSLLDRVGKMEGRSIETLLDVAYRWDRGQKAELLQGTDAAKHFVGNSDAGHDVDSTMGVFAQGLRYLPRLSGMGEDRSIRDFVRDVVRIKEEGPDALVAEIETVDPVTGEIFAGHDLNLDDPAGQKRRDEIIELARVIKAGQTPWMFLSAETEKLDALMPLMACWIDLAVTSILGLRPREDRRIWIVLDEWHTLGKLTRLQDILTEGAKYGACVIAGTQNVGQIRENYGPDSAEAMLSLFNTKAVFRLPEPVSAEWASKYMGDLVWDQARESVRYGTSETMDGASIADGRVVERKVMPHEIIDLPDRTAYLSISGDFPTARISTPFNPKTDPAILNVPPFIARPFQELAWISDEEITRPRQPVAAEDQDRDWTRRLQRPAEQDDTRGPERSGVTRPRPDPGPVVRKDRPEETTGDQGKGPRPMDATPPVSQPLPRRPANEPDFTGMFEPDGDWCPENMIFGGDDQEGADHRDHGPATDADDGSVAKDGETFGTDEQPDLFEEVPLEVQIKALKDAGMSIRQISDALKVTRYRVETTLNDNDKGDA